MSNTEKSRYPVYIYPLNEARTSNRTFEEAKIACKKLYTLDEFKRGMYKHIDTLAKEIGMENDSLTIEEVQCLSWYGMTSQQIRSCSLPDFDKIYHKNRKQFDLWLEKAEKLFDKEIAEGVKIISIQDGEYPLSLDAIGKDAPPLIHLIGNDDLIIQDAVAIIGARAADSTGVSAAYNLGARYAQYGKVVVSGLALGCDKAAHEGCLSVGGKTIAVVASGLDITHPRENKPVQDKILENGGLIMSEHGFGIKANPTRLIARNRLQAALSRKVILAQCPEHSGSMHTMRFARKYEKECLAVAFARYSDINGGNKLLIDSNLANPITL